MALTKCWQASSLAVFRLKMSNNWILRWIVLRGAHHFSAQSWGNRAKHGHWQLKLWQKSVRWFAGVSVRVSQRIKPIFDTECYFLSTAKGLSLKDQY